MHKNLLKLPTLPEANESEEGSSMVDNFSQGSDKVQVFSSRNPSEKGKESTYQLLFRQKENDRQLIDG